MNAGINKMMQEWTPAWKYGDLVNTMKHTKKYGTTRAQRRGLARCNETTKGKRGYDTNSTSRKRTSSAQVRRRLWQARHMIRSERQRQRFGQALTHRGQVGRGTRDVTKTPPGLTMLHNDDGCTTTAQQDIAARATEYYGRLFGPPQDDDNEDTGYGMNLNELLRRLVGVEHWSHERGRCTMPEKQDDRTRRDFGRGSDGMGGELPVHPHDGGASDGMPRADDGVSGGERRAAKISPKACSDRRGGEHTHPCARTHMPCRARGARRYSSPPNIHMCARPPHPSLLSRPT